MKKSTVCVICLTLPWSSAPACGGIIANPVVIARTGTLPPTGDRNLTALLTPSIDAEGNVLFLGTAFNRGIWAGKPGSMQLVAMERAAAPGTTQTFSSMFFAEPEIRSSNQVGFYSRITGPTANSDGLWLGSPGNVQLVARAGDPAPGTAMNFDRFFFATFHFGSGNNIAFRMGPGSAPRGIWAGTPGNLQLVSLEGAVAPGKTNTFSSFTTPSINSHGQVAFFSRLSGFLYSVWFGTPGSLHSITTGDPAPGAGTGVTFSSLTEDVMASLNTQGQIAFRARLSDGASTMWVASNSGKQLLASTKLPVPGYPNGVSYFDPWTVRLNNHGEAVFRSHLLGSPTGSEQGIFAGTNTSDLRMVVRKGQQAPGFPAGVTFNFLSEYTINDAGWIMFRADLAGPGITPQNGTGFWISDPLGLRVIVRLGDMIEFAPGLFDTISQLSWSVEHDVTDATEPTAPWNEKGQFVFQAGLQSNGTANFLITVPEPPSYLLAVLALAGLAGYRRHIATRRRNNRAEPNP